MHIDLEKNWNPIHISAKIVWNTVILGEKSQHTTRPVIVENHAHWPERNENCGLHDRDWHQPIEDGYEDFGAVLLWWVDIARKWSPNQDWTQVCECRGAGRLKISHEMRSTRFFSVWDSSDAPLMLTNQLHHLAPWNRQLSITSVFRNDCPHALLPAIVPITRPRFFAVPLIVDPLHKVLIFVHWHATSVHG